MPESDGAFPNAESAKNYKLQILTEEYSHLTRENKEAWIAFKPDGYDHRMELKTPYGEYEAEEPLFAATQRARMLQEINSKLFPPHVLPGFGDTPIPEDSDIDFQF